MIFSDDAKFQNMLTRFNTVQRSSTALEHAHQLAVDVGVDVMTASPRA